MSYRDDISKIFKVLVGRDDVEFEVNKKGHLYQVKIKAPLSEFNYNLKDLISMGLESSLAILEKISPGKEETVVVNLSGRGDKDMEIYIDKLGL